MVNMFRRLYAQCTGILQELENQDVTPHKLWINPYVVNANLNLRDLRDLSSYVLHDFQEVSTVESIAENFVLQFFSYEILERKPLQNLRTMFSYRA